MTETIQFSSFLPEIFSTWRMRGGGKNATLLILHGHLKNWDGKTLPVIQNITSGKQLLPDYF